MENINDHISKINDQLSALEDLVDQSRSAFLSSKLSIDRVAVFDIIDELHLIVDEISKDLPNEIKQARRLINEGDKIISDARNKAGLIISTAEAQANVLVDDHEIIKQANEIAAKIVDEAKKSSREFKRDAVEYADNALSNVEDTMRDAMNKFAATAMAFDEQLSDAINSLYDTRKEIRGGKSREEEYED